MAENFSSIPGFIEMIPFRFVDFYDVPRCIATRYRGTLLLLLSAFDEQLDDYEDTYSVYKLPESIGNSLDMGSWDFLATTATQPIAKIPVESVRFDPSSRKELDAICLKDLGLEYQ